MILNILRKLRTHAQFVAFLTCHGFNFVTYRAWGIMPDTNQYNAITIYGKGGHTVEVGFNLDDTVKSVELW